MPITAEAIKFLKVELRILYIPILPILILNLYKSIAEFKYAHMEVARASPPTPKGCMRITHKSTCISITTKATFTGVFVF
jgi:hypothetical protein